MMQDYQDLLCEIHKELVSCPELWEERYGGYARAIDGSSEKLQIHVNKPLFQYTTVSNETAGGLKSILRFCGQEVGAVQLRGGMYRLVVSPDNAKNNRTYFQAEGVPVVAGSYAWRSKDGESFRRFFRDCGIQQSKSPEHTLESMVLTELEKSDSRKKSLLQIAPVKIAGRRFQMPTPIRGSQHQNIHVAKNGIGGGIDILARQRQGNCSYLNVIELKDEYSNHEPPAAVIRQAIAYAVFLRELIRSDVAEGPRWCKLFGIRYPEKELVLRCTAAMTDIADESTFCNVDELYFPDDSGDRLELHLMNVSREGDAISLEFR